MANLVNVGLGDVGVQIFVTASEVEGWLAGADDIDRDRDYVFVEVDGVPVAYVLTPTHVEHEGRRIYRHNGRVDPAWKRKGIGTALLDWVIARNEEKAASLGPGTLQTSVDNEDPVLIRMLSERGYEQVEGDAELVRPDLENIADRPLPDGLEIRAVTEDHLRLIYDADYEAFRDHWGARTQSEGDWSAFLRFAHRDETLWKVAWDGDRVAGQVRGYINQEENDQFGRLRGWAEFISTAADWRGRGVASALICETLREFAARGLDEAALGVHVGNPTGAFSLYQGLGFEIVSTSETYERPLVLG
jgi:ribosomal protein S18 acetylase RimI-like enzyme